MDSGLKKLDVLMCQWYTFDSHDEILIDNFETGGTVSILPMLRAYNHA